MSTKTEDDIEFLAPENFSMVETGVYRSAFPRTKNIEFLKQLNLKSVVSLVPEDYPAAMLDLYNANGIKLIPIGLDGNKWPFKEINHESLQLVLDKIMNPANRPLLIHCNKGKHRTGSVVGSLRRIRGWALSAVFTEYLLFASPKTRLEDQQLIESFQYVPSNIPNADASDGDQASVEVIIPDSNIATCQVDHVEAVEVE